MMAQEKKIVEFKDVAHHYLTSGVMCHFYKVGKEYSAGEHDGYAQLNYTHLELLKGGQWILVPVLRDHTKMADAQVMVMMDALGTNASDIVEHVDSRKVKIVSEQDGVGYAWWVAIESYGDLSPVAYCSTHFQDCADYLRNCGYDIHGLAAAGRATLINDGVTTESEVQNG